MKIKKKKNQIKTLPVINIESFSAEEKGRLLSLYEKLKKVSFHPFPEEFGLALTGDGARK